MHQSDFPEYAINDESKLKLQLIISEILGHRNSKWLRYLHVKLILSIYLLTLFRMGEAKSPTPTSFAIATSTNARISTQNFLTISFNPFVTLV